MIQSSNSAEHPAGLTKFMRAQDAFVHLLSTSLIMPVEDVLQDCYMTKSSKNADLFVE